MASKDIIALPDGYSDFYLCKSHLNSPLFDKLYTELVGEVWGDLAGLETLVAVIGKPAGAKN
jgi:hypothetical protein